MVLASLQLRTRPAEINIGDLDLLQPTPPVTPLEPSPSGIKFPSFYRSEANVYQREGEPSQSIIDDEIWPPIFKAQSVRSAKTMVPRANDVFVCTYPKCGTTWIQHICSQLMQDNYGPQVGKVTELSLTSPMIERMGAKFADELPSPRLLKTHFTYRNCPQSSSAKYIYAVRNPKDALVSYYFHNRNFKIYNWADGDFDVFFDMFINNELAFGGYFDHMMSWLDHIEDDNVLFLKYEDMCADLETAVRKIGNFLGGRAAEIVNDPELLAHIVEESKIDAMKKNQGRWFPGSVLRQETFIRKGGSRDWKNHFSRAQSDLMDRLFATSTAGTVAEHWWKAEMSWDDDYTEQDEQEEQQFMEESHLSSVPLASSSEVPEIVLTEPTYASSDEGIGSYDETEMDGDVGPSISRRNSAVNWLKPYGSERRGSIESTSTGYCSSGSSVVSQYKPYLAKLGRC